MEYKALLNVSTLTSNIKQFNEEINNKTTDLEAIGYKFETVHTEDLLDFEWNVHMVYSALPVWKKLLKSWGIRPHKTNLLKYLKHHAGTREAPRNHHDTIYNSAQVNEAVSNN